MEPEFRRRYPFLRTSDALALRRRFGRIPSAPPDLLQTYWTSYRRAPSREELPEADLDLVFVLPPSARGWVLEGICRDIARVFSGRWAIHEGFKNLPPARGYFYAHHSFFPRCLKLNPALWHAANLVFFTHPSELSGCSLEELVLALGCATRVLSMCSQHSEELVRLGVPAGRIRVALAGADPEVFLPHQRGSGAVGLCSAFYPRKNPKLIQGLIREMPGREFILLGRGWEAYEQFEELRALPNLTYREVPYSEYPAYYARMDVFVSPSKLEGGPIPLLEAMMCNVVPVASRTGFAPDIVGPDAGYLFEPDASPAALARLVERAFAHQGDVSRGVRHLTWRRYAGVLEAELRAHERTLAWTEGPRAARVSRAAFQVVRSLAAGLRRVGLPVPVASLERDWSIVQELSLQDLFPPRQPLAKRDTSLEVRARGGGERQAAPTVEGIRQDHQARYRFAARLLAEPARVLDMACGVGYGARILAESPNCSEVVAIDRSPEALEYARAHFSGPGIEFRLGDCLTSPLEEGAYDLGVCFETLEHIQDAAGLLARFRHALRPGARLVLSTPNQEILPHDRERFPFHCRHYTPAELKDLVEQSGLVIEELLHQETKHSCDLRPGAGGAFLVLVGRNPAG